MNNLFLAIIGLFFCAALHSQSHGETNKDSINILFKAAGEAYRTYDYNNSIEYSLKLIRLASKEKDVGRLYDGYNLLGITYEVLEDTLRAKENYQKALVYAKASKNDTLLWYAYNNLGNILSINKKTLEEGLNSYEKAIEISEASGSLKDALTPMTNIAWTHLENGNHIKAAPYLKRAWQLGRDNNDLALQSNLLTLFGMYHSGRKELEESKEHFETAIAKAEEDTLLIAASFAYKEFSNMLFNNENFKEAYVALQKHQEYRERIFQKEKNHQREIVYGRFQTEEYKKDLAAAKVEEQYNNEILEKTRETTIVMTSSTVVMLVFLILLLRSNRLRRRLIKELRLKNSDLTNAKEKAEQLSLLKTRLFSTVSHELRTPLYGVIGLASLILEDSENESQRDDLKSLKFSADYLLALINDVLEMNKMESNLVTLESHDFQIDKLLTGIIRSFEATRICNNNVIRLNIDPEIPKNLVGDSIRLSQIMMNLIGNAVKFTEGGVISIRAEKRKNSEHNCSIYFEVRDTGQGIPENKQQEIFEEFAQLKSDNLSYQGTGLGLSIVKKLLKLYDSEIHLSSSPGNGAIFSFVIVFKKGLSRSLKAVEQEVIQSEVPDIRQRILVVDDNRINQVVTRRILETREFECIVASSGEEAIHKLKEEHVDLVLLDINMPGINGIQTAQEIRKFLPMLPIIALTAVEVGEIREEVLQAGMNDIINKPYDIPQFFNIILQNIRQCTPSTSY